MNKIIEKIEKELLGEKLLLDNKTEYSYQELILMKSAIYTRLATNCNYGELLYGDDSFYKLVKVCGSSMFNLDDDIDNIILEIAAKERRGYTKEENERKLDWAGVAISETYGCPSTESYAKMIKTRIQSPKEVARLFEDGQVMYRINNINFVITNNFLITRYPEFYNKNYIGQLKEALLYYDKEHFVQKEDWNNYKKARKTLIKNIGKYEEKKKTNIVKKLCLTKNKKY